MARKFEQSKLTDLIEFALKKAVLSIQCGNQEPTLEDLEKCGEIHELIEKISLEKLDVRFVTREY